MRKGGRGENKKKIKEWKRGRWPGRESGKQEKWRKKQGAQRYYFTVHQKKGCTKL